MNARNGFLLLALCLFLYVVSPLILPVLMGGILAVIFTPWAHRLDRRGLHPKLSAAAVTLGVTVVLLVPLTVMSYLGLKSGLAQLELLKQGPRINAGTWVDGFLSSGPVNWCLDVIGLFVPVNRADLLDTGRDFLGSLGGKAADWLAQLASRLPGTALDLLMIVVSLFFLLADGALMVAFIRKNSIFEPRATERLMERLAVMCRSVILASVLSGVSQAVLAIIACLAVGQPSAILVGLLVFLASFLPVVGAVPVTLGVALYQLFAVSTGAGIAMFVAMLVIGGIDNIVRAAVLRGSANLHPLLAFAAAFGGLQAFGFLGIFLGPIITSLFLSTLEVVGPAASRTAH